MQIALLKNRGLQAAFNDLGVSEADYVQASLPPEPDRLSRSLGGSLELEIERQILIGLFELATLPARAAIAEQRFRAAQFRTAEAVLRLAAETRRQYYRTVAANQQVAFMQQALGIGRDRLRARQAARRERRPQQAGAGPRARLLRQELGAQLARARIEQKVARERLIRQLGLWGRDIDFRLPELPAAPAGPHRLGPGDRAPGAGAARRPPGAAAST